MKPGRELDFMIAKLIFGRLPVWSGKNQTILSDGEPQWDWVRFEGSELMNEVPYYSEDLESAWTIVDAIHFDFTLTSNTDQPCGPEDCWQADFYAGEFKASGCSPAHAICLAALKTKEPRNVD